MRLVFLDTGTLGMVANPRGSPRALRCQQWARNLLAAGVRVFVPKICDDEELRKLIHAGSMSRLARLDRLKIGFDYAPITTDVMLRAAELWATARCAGLPTTPPDALEGDVILAAQVIFSAGVGDIATVSTENVGHLARFVAAQSWDKIAP